MDCHLFVCRYFLKKLRRVKKANGQILAANEVRHRALDLGSEGPS